MAKDIFLLNISGQDKPGLTSSLTSVLAQYGAKILDIKGQLSDTEIIFHCGTKLENGQIISDGGRVLASVALANDFKSAIDKSYQIVDKVKWSDCYYRRDIGRKLLKN